MLLYLRPNYYIAINSALDITMLIRQTLITYSVILICNFLHNIHIYMLIIIIHTVIIT